MKDKFKIGRTLVSITCIEDTIEKIKFSIKSKQTVYICVANFYSTSHAHFNKEYRDVVNNAYLNTPDGMPLVWASRLWGLKQVNRTSGPDLFIRILKENNAIRHYLLGDTDEVLNKLSNICRNSFHANIVGTYSPPFTALTEYDYKKIAELINITGADIVWIALGSPKQDFFSKNLTQYLDSKIAIGVGAAFRFVLDEYKYPMILFQKLGLTGFFWRFRSQRLKKIWWYITHFIILSFLFLQIIGKRLIGIKYYE